MPGKPQTFPLLTRSTIPVRNAVILIVGVVLLLGLISYARLAPPSALTSLDEILLTPADFPSAGLFEVQRLGQRETRDGGHTTQVALQSETAQLNQIVVAFPSENAARGAFDTIRQGRAQERLRIISDAPSFGQESVVLAGQQGDEVALSTAFRQGELLVRLNLVPAKEMQELLPYAQKAAEKARKARLR